MLLSLRVIALMAIFAACNQSTPTRRHNKNIGRTVVSQLFSNKSAASPNKIYDKNKNLSCRWLRGFKKQSKQCRNRRGFSAVLLEARSLAVNHCLEQFKYDRWNCAYKKSMFRRVYRETAFMYAISAAAVMYATAKACSEGRLQKCYCAQQPRFPRKGDWQWGGCGDNTKAARGIAERFLRLDEDTRGPINVLNHDISLGFGAVKEHEEKTCTCHGVSASCVLETCWKTLRPFKAIAEALKQKYRQALKASPANRTSALLYAAQSPNFCAGTGGRECRDHDHCATLCCGRGYDHGTVSVSRRCRCRWYESEFQVRCDVCEKDEDRFTCK